METSTPLHFLPTTLAARQNCLVSEWEESCKQWRKVHGLLTPILKEGGSGDDVVGDWVFDIEGSDHSVVVIFEVLSCIQKLCFERQKMIVMIGMTRIKNWRRSRGKSH